jgi:hypothetical protein
MKLRISLSLLTLSIVSACGGATPKKEIAQPDGDESSAPAAEYARPGTGRAPAAAPRMQREAEKSAEEGRAYDSERSRGDAYDDVAPSPMPRRPGLATQWGEQRDSEVREVYFERQRSTPAGVIRVHYDDEAGIEAATGRSADDAYPRTFPVRGGSLTVSITDDDGDPLPSLVANGTDHVVGDSGDRYMIQIKNYTAGRFEIVASVDGLDVLDGDDGGFDNRGYLVSPWSTLTIEGFRESHETVRAFRFGDVETGYAVRRGKGRNVGVIGVAVFEERGFRFGYDDDELHRRRTADPFPGRFAPPPR